MKPLSSSLYLKNNLNKMLPQFISISLCVFLVYSIAMIFYSGIFKLQSECLNIYDKVTIIKSAKNSKIPDDIMSRLSGTKLIPIPEEIGSYKYKTMLLQGGFSAVSLYKEDLPEVLRLFNLSFIQGRAPICGKREVIIPYNYAKQNKISVGDIIGRNNDKNAYLNDNYRVCGILNGNLSIILTCYNGEEKREEALQHELMFEINNKSNRSISDSLEDKKRFDAIIAGYKTGKNQIYITNSLNASSIILDLIIIIVFCIGISNINYILLLGRRKEFSVLEALGYSTKVIYKKVLKESFLVISIAYLLGVMISILISQILNITIWQPSGQEVYIFRMNYLIPTILIPVFAFAVNLILTYWVIKSNEYKSLDF